MKGQEALSQRFSRCAGVLVAGRHSKHNQQDDGGDAPMSEKQ
jgi:hypothetical protein